MKSRMPPGNSRQIGRAGRWKGAFCVGQYTIGVDVGGTKIAYGLFDDQQKLVCKNKVRSDPSLEAADFFDVLAGGIRKLMKENGLTNDHVRGVGIGMPSYILFEEGRILKTTNLTKIHDFPARKYLMDRLDGLRVILDNDSHVAALAEYKMGAGRGFPHMVYCAVSTGIASGIIINGQLFRGRYGWAGETGHMLITPGEGIPCGCGQKGCFMSYCSGSMIVKHIRNKIAAGEPTLMTELAGSPENISAVHIQQAFDQGDAMAQWAVGQMAQYLAVWLYNLYQVLNINCFVFGGGLVHFGDRLFPRVRELFDGYNNNDLPVYFKFAELKDDFGMVGAAQLLL